MFNPLSLRLWGATDAEAAASMPGDDLVANASMSATRSISIAAPRSQVFPWLTQMGFGKAGWYSYDLIDNLGRESARTLVPEWQVDSVGDVLPAGPLDFLVTTIDPDEAFCFLLKNRWCSFSLAFLLSEQVRGTRLVSRARARIDTPLGELLVKGFLEPGDGAMVRRQLLGIKERAEAST